jgi:hypothetical protein
MTKVKHQSLSLSPELLEGFSKKTNEFFKFFSTDSVHKKMLDITDGKRKIYELALLAFLDALGYSKRVLSSHNQLFVKVLKRYEDIIANFQRNNLAAVMPLGNLYVLNDNALSLSLDDNTIDGIITSPPYSFAIDYVKNDEAQLNYFGCDINHIRENMIGLRGKNKDERLSNYFIDMDKACSEMARVLKNDRFCVMIIGSNTNQTGGIRLEQKIGTLSGSTERKDSV